MTYDEAMARLRAVEALPVGERMARWCERNGSPIGARSTRKRARPLRIARWRAQWNRRESDAITRVCDRQRAALEQAYEYLSDTDVREIRGIAAGTVQR